MLSNFLLAVIAILLFLVTCIIVYLFVDATNLEIFKRKKSRQSPSFQWCPSTIFCVYALIRPCICKTHMASQRKSIQALC